ncbi:MAG: hypothetical protein Q9201_006632 [Fulgogasparrea decipioides]
MGACECPIVPYYVDPIHDFAICKYEVSSLENFEVKQIQLKPELAEVGLEIRVFGNDSGQTLSILPGVISRVDRNPLHWDALIPYIQASADSSNGASGSPVITQSGHAVGLVAGGFHSSSTDFFLPLDRPKRALQSLIDGQPILRGSIQSNWLRETRAECSARGLDSQSFKKYCPGGGGLLRADKILPEGSSAGKIQEGDLLLQADGQNISSLAAFEDLIDHAVGSSITLLVRRWLQNHKVVLDVKDLFALVPCKIFEYAGSFFQDLRYELALKCNLPLKGVILFGTRGCFDIDRDHIMIISLNLRSTPNLCTFIEVAREIPVDLQTDSSKGVLEKRSLPSSSATKLHPNVKRRPVPYSVRVKAATQGPINGALPSKANFLSIIVNETEGFVIVPQAVVPSSIGSITIVFEGSIELPATKVFESTSGWAIAKYDPALIEGRVEPATFSDIPFEIGDKTTIYGLNRDGDHPCMVEATVTQIAPLPNDYDTSLFHHPIHLEVLHFQDTCASTPGVLLDDTGNVVGLWLPFPLFHDGKPIYVGIPVSIIKSVLEQLQQGFFPKEPRLLDVLLETVSKNDAISFGVPEGIAGRDFVRVAEVSCTHQALEAGDFLLRHGSKSISKLSDLYGLTQERVNLSIMRASIAMQLEVPTITMAAYLVDRAVWFCGAQLETPYPPLHFTTRKLYSRIWISEILPGSPAQMYGLPPSHFVTGVNDKLTEDLDSLIREAAVLPEDQYCQITCLSRVGVQTTVALKPNMRDFKTVEVRKKEDCQGWLYREL